METGAACASNCSRAIPFPWVNKGVALSTWIMSLGGIRWFWVSEVGDKENEVFVLLVLSYPPKSWVCCEEEYVRNEGTVEEPWKGSTSASVSWERFLRRRRKRIIRMTNIISTPNNWPKIAWVTCVERSVGSSVGKNAINSIRITRGWAGRNHRGCTVRRQDSGNSGRRFSRGQARRRD